MCWRLNGLEAGWAEQVCVLRLNWAGGWAGLRIGWAEHGWARLRMAGLRDGWAGLRMG